MAEATPTETPASVARARPPSHARDAIDRLALLEVTARDALEAYNRTALSPLFDVRRHELQDAMDQLALALYGDVSGNYAAP